MGGLRRKMILLVYVEGGTEVLMYDHGGLCCGEQGAVLNVVRGTIGKKSSLLTCCEEISSCELETMFIS